MGRVLRWLRIAVFFGPCLLILIFAALFKKGRPQGDPNNPLDPYNYPPMTVVEVERKGKEVVVKRVRRFTPEEQLEVLDADFRAPMPFALPFWKKKRS